MASPRLSGPGSRARAPGTPPGSWGSSTPLAGAVDKARGTPGGAGEMQVHVGRVDVPLGEPFRSPRESPCRRDAGMDPAGVMKLVPPETLAPLHDHGVPRGE